MENYWKGREEGKSGIVLFIYRASCGGGYEAYRGLVRSKSQYELLVLRYAELCRAKALPMSQGTTWNVANESCRSRVETRETRWLFPVSRRHALPTNNFHQIEISYRNLSSILPSSLLFLSRLSRDKRLSKEILYWEEVLKTNINPRSLRKKLIARLCFKFVLRIIHSVSRERI